MAGMAPPSSASNTTVTRRRITLRDQHRRAGEALGRRQPQQRGCDLGRRVGAVGVVMVMRVGWVRMRHAVSPDQGRSEQIEFVLPKFLNWCVLQK